MMQTATSDPNSSTYSPSIHWMPHGKSFVITDPDAFSADVLSRYFKSTKFKSFTRKLYRWGFRAITKGPDKGSYYHELFVRDDPGLCVRMNCNYSDKELKTQADNAAKRRASYGSVERPTGRRNSGARDALAAATERLTLGGGGGAGGAEDDDEMAILRAAAVFGGGGSRTSLGGSKGRCSVSMGRLSGASGRRGSGTQFKQAQRRVSSNCHPLSRRQSAGSAISGLEFDDDDDDESESMSDAAGAGAAVGVPTSINVGGSAVENPQHQAVDASIAAQSSSAVTAAVAAAQAQAAAQYSAMAGGASSAGGGAAVAPKTAEEILAQHRLEDAILAQQETAIRERRQQLQREQEERLKALDLMAAAKAQGGGALDVETAAKMKQMQEEMRVAQLQKEEEDRLKALELAKAELVKAAGPQMAVGAETTVPLEPDHPTALDILAAAANETSGKAACQYQTAAAIEQELLADAMKKYQEQG
jgi:hypothetical protein